MAESAGGPQDPSGTDSFSGAPNPGDTSSDQPWYRPTDTSIPAPVDEVGLDAPTVARKPEIANLPPEALMPARSIRTREELRGMVHEVSRSPEVVDQRLARGIESVNDFLAQPTVRKWQSEHPYKPTWEKNTATPAERVNEYETAFHQAIEDAKQGKLGEVKLAWGEASGIHGQSNNIRDILEQANSKLRGISNSFHSMMSAGRSRMAETVELSSKDDVEGTLRAMAIGQDHSVGITVSSETGYTDRFYITPVKGVDSKPTGMWLRIESGAFTTPHYKTDETHITGMTLLVPPYGETPKFTDTMRQQAMRPLYEKRDAFKQYMDSATSELPPDINPAPHIGRQPDESPPIHLQGENSAHTDVTVHSHTRIKAGDEHFTLDWSDDGANTALTNEDLRWHLLSELNAVNLELPYEEQKNLRSMKHGLVDELTSVTLQVGQPVVIGRSVEGPRLASDEHLSRQHFSVELQADGSVKIIDLGGANGTDLYSDELKQKAHIISEVPQFTEPAPSEMPTSDAAEPQNRRRGLLRRRK